jgi:peptidoglycan/LPS O-acetylase OafA/YrhL
MTTTQPTAAPSRTTERAATYGRQMSGVMLAAFALSVVHTVYAAVEGIEDPTFTVTTPLAWGFYALAFAMSAVARRPGRGAQAAVLTFLAAVLVIAVFYYPTTFGPEKQTVFGWFENDVYVGLLLVATYLGVHRWRGTVIRPS